MRELRKIAVLGGGNIGTHFACVCAAKGLDVNVFTSRPELYDGDLEAIDENGVASRGTIALATSDLRAACEERDVIFITYPASCFDALASELAPLVSERTILVVVPGSGGVEFAFRSCVEKGAVLCGLQRVPAVARLIRYGKNVRATGLRDRLHLAALDSERAPEISMFVGGLFGIPCETLPNYLCVTLTPSNPILHTTRLRSLFSDYRPGVVYEREPLFYEDWNDETSRLLFACDEELQQICRRIESNRLDLTSVRSLKLHYESETPEKLTTKIRGIRGFRGIKTPMKAVENGFIPDFESRYFSTDFPYGLAIIEELSEIIGVVAPNIVETMAWYREVTGDQTSFGLRDRGVNSLGDLYVMENI